MSLGVQHDGIDQIVFGFDGDTRGNCNYRLPAVQAEHYSHHHVVVRLVSPDDERS